MKGRFPCLSNRRFWKRSGPYRSRSSKRARRARLAGRYVQDAARTGAEASNIASGFAGPSTAADTFRSARRSQHDRAVALLRRSAATYTRTRGWRGIARAGPGSRNADCRQGRSRQRTGSGGASHHAANARRKAPPPNFIARSCDAVPAVRRGRSSAPNGTRWRSTTRPPRWLPREVRRCASRSGARPSSPLS